MDRGGCYNVYGSASLGRSAGNRDGAGQVTRVLSTLGFRLNGVIRGSSFTLSSGFAYYFRSGGYRNETRAKTYVGIGIGFR